MRDVPLCAFLTTRQMAPNTRDIASEPTFPQRREASGVLAMMILSPMVYSGWPMPEQQSIWSLWKVKAIAGRCGATGSRRWGYQEPRWQIRFKWNISLASRKSSSFKNLIQLVKSLPATSENDSEK